MEEVKEVSPIRVRKSYSRPTTVRFTTDEARVILMAMHYAKHHQVFVNEGEYAVGRSYEIISKLKHRIEQERIKNENSGGDQGEY